MYLGVTVRELFDACREEMFKGNGGKHILISEDDEGNGFHSLFYLFTDGRDMQDMIDAGLVDENHTTENSILLG